MMTYPQMIDALGGKRSCRIGSQGRLTHFCNVDGSNGNVCLSIERQLLVTVFLREDRSTLFQVYYGSLPPRFFSNSRLRCGLIAILDRILPVKVRVISMGQSKKSLAFSTAIGRVGPHPTGTITIEEDGFPYRFNGFRHEPLSALEKLAYADLRRKHDYL